MSEATGVMEASGMGEASTLGAATPIGFGRALVEQLRWFWQRLWLWIAVVTVIPAVGVAWIISVMPDDAGPLTYVIFGAGLHPLLVLIALSWALSAWRDDAPKDRQYFWLHPVERTSHTIARTLAGFLWLMVVLVVLGATVYISTRAAIPADMAGDNARLWLYSLCGIVIAYLAASIPALLSDKPVIWILVLVGLVLILASLAGYPKLEWLQPIMEVFIGGSVSFGTALGAPGSEAARLMFASAPPDAALNPQHAVRVMEARPGTALLIWLPITLVAYLVAARLSRPR